MSDITKWEEFKNKQKELLIYGLENGLINLYDDEFILKLREIYYGGVPASIILLSNHLSNGHCYDRALLLSRVFLDTDDDVKLVYAGVDSLRLNPNYIGTTDNYDDHCFVERVCSDGRHLIYDTSLGFIYDKDLYFEMEHPTVRKVNDKESIKRFVEKDMEEYATKNEYDPFVTDMIIPFIECSYGHCREIYAQEDFPILQEEIEYYKKINKEILENNSSNYYRKVR